MMHDLINDAIVAIKNAERVGKVDVVVKPTSKMLISILLVFQKEGYIGEFEVIENSSGNEIKVSLSQKINECGVIKPRFPVKHNEYVKWEKQYLPARDFGAIVVSTSQGIISHKDAKEKGIGGRLLAYVY